MSIRRHALIILCLLSLSALVQGVMIARAVTPSLDAVRFVRTAQQVDQQGAAAVVRRGGEQPLFPIWTAAVHRTLLSLFGPSPSSWALAVQLAAAFPLVLAVVPVYLLLVRLYGVRVAVIGALFFCMLPELRRLGPDGLSDSVHLFFFAGALWAVVEYWTSTVSSRSRSLWLIAAGLWTGLALLARAEAIVLPCVLFAALAAVCIARRSIVVLRNTTSDALGYAFGLMLVLVPYLAVSGASTPQAAVARILGQSAPATIHDSSQLNQLLAAASDKCPMDFAVKEGTLRHKGLLAATGQYADELADVFGYWVGLLAIVGLVRHGREFRRPVDRFLQAFFVLFSLIIIGFVSREGYLDARHLLPLLIVGLGVTSMGLWDVGEWLVLGAMSTLAWTCRRKHEHNKTIPQRVTTWMVASLMTVVVLVYLGTASRPLRAERLAHRQAGQWLARQADQDAAVLDTRGWAGLYSARPLYQYHEVKTALADCRLGYVVVRDEELQSDTRRAKTLRWLLTTGGQEAARFAPLGTTDTVAVYRWSTKRFRQNIERPRAARVARSTDPSPRNCP